MSEQPNTSDPEMDEIENQKSEPFVSHLIELRNRMLWAVGAVLILFFALVPFANELYEWFAKPLISNLPQGGTMISTEPHGPFFIPFKFAFATAFALAIPVVLYQAWAFVAPGLYSREKEVVLPLIVSSMPSLLNANSSPPGVPISSSPI